MLFFFWIFTEQIWERLSVALASRIRYGKISPYEKKRIELMEELDESLGYLTDAVDDLTGALLEQRSVPEEENPDTGGGG